MPKDLKSIRIPVNTALIPRFYQNFHCLCGECKDTCCAGWRIGFDKEDYQMLQNLDAPLELRQQLDKLIRLLTKDDPVKWYAEFYIEDNNYQCPLQNSEGLCSLQLACGFEALPKVCRFFPRLDCYTVAAREYSLSLGCESVLQQLWDLPEGIDFIEEALPTNDKKIVHIKQEENLLPFFPDIRSLCIDILQNRQLPLTERMILLGIALQNLLEMNWQKPNVESWLWQMQRLLADSASLQQLTNQIPGNIKMFVFQNLKILSGMHQLASKWILPLFQALNVDLNITTESSLWIEKNVNYSQENYQKLAEKFQQAFNDKEYFWENLIIAQAFRRSFPNLNSKEDLWQSYVTLCNLYGLFRFVAIVGCGEEQTKKQLFHMLVMAARAFTHDDMLYQRKMDELFQNESSSLAHMAILLRYI